MPPPKASNLSNSEPLMEDVAKSELVDGFAK